MQAAGEGLPAALLHHGPRDSLGCRADDSCLAKGSSLCSPSRFQVPHLLQICGF